MDGFDLKQGEIAVGIADETTGRRWEFTHVFRPATEAEYLQYSRAASMVRVVGGVVDEPDRGRAELELWSACVIRVEGPYLWDGRPLMDEADWKAKIPVLHKIAAARQLVDVRRRMVDGPLA